MTDLVQLILMGIACSATCQLGFLWGKRHRHPVGPIDLIDIYPMPYAAFAPGTRIEARIAFLEDLARDLRERRSVEAAGLDGDARDDS